jgi:hypothetical protein
VPYSNRSVFLKVEAAFARGICQRLDPPVIKIATAIEYHVLDALLLGTLGDQFADRLGSIDIGKDFSSEDAAASVSPFESSMTWA